MHFSTYRIDAGNSVVAGSQIDWYGIVSGNNITNLTRVAGATDAGSNIGDVVEAMPTGSWAQGIYEWGTTHADTEGNLLPAAVQTALGITASPAGGWDLLNAGTGPNTVTYNGNRSYALTFNGVDLTGALSAGMRLRTTRTVAAPTQSTSLNGTSQYYSKSAPAGMTSTDDIASGVWFKLNNYPTTTAGVISRLFGGSSANGWTVRVLNTGQIQMVGHNVGSGNFRGFQTYQSVPLNKWVHIAVQLDMSEYTATATTMYAMINGADVPVQLIQNGTNPNSFGIAGDFEVGSESGGATPFPGKIAQAFVSSGKISQANMRSLYSQGLTPALIAANNIVSAYSFNNTVNDLNTTNANNLTANGGAVATNADSPFGRQASGNISSTLDYALVTGAAFSTNTTITVRVPEGCTIPTSGGVSNVYYSNVASPYGFSESMVKSCRRLMSMTINAQQTTSSTTIVQFQPIKNITITVPSDCSTLRFGMFQTSLSGGGIIVMKLYNGSINVTTNELVQINQNNSNGYAFIEAPIPVVPGETLTLNMGWLTTSATAGWNAATATSRQNEAIWIDCE